METEVKVNYDLLREQIHLISKELNACKGFVLDIDSIVDLKTFKSFIRRNYFDVGEKLGCDVYDSGEIDDLKDTIDDLEYEISSLNDVISDYKDTYGASKNLLSEDYKIRWFLENKDKYTEWELKDLLENGVK